MVWSVLPGHKWRRYVQRGSRSVLGGLRATIVFFYSSSHAEVGHSQGRDFTARLLCGSEAWCIAQV